MLDDDELQHCLSLKGTVMDPKSWTKEGLFLDGGRH
jgi:hypothetical protein